MPPASIEVTPKVASMRQIHAAIEHEAKQNFECSITLAAAGEGMLLVTENEHFHKKVKEFAASLPEATEGATGPNDVITWLKHGTYKGKKCEKATIEHVLDSRAKCNRALCEPDLHVFAKLFEDCLKRSLEAQAFSGREIGGNDDVLDFLVGHFVDVDLTRQPAS